MNNLVFLLIPTGPISYATTQICSAKLAQVLLICLIPENQFFSQLAKHNPNLFIGSTLTQLHNLLFYFFLCTYCPTFK